MDAEIQQIYDLLVDTNYPITLAELRNPTSDCMVKVVLTFLSGISIDGKTIQRVTFDQEQSLSYPEVYQEMISMINLHVVISRICECIFIKDFYLTDISSPGVKKARRLIRTLLNFVLYMVNKMEELTEPLEIIFSRLNTLSDHTEKKSRDMELRKEIVLENSKKAAFKEKLLKQIEEAKRQDGDQNNKVTMLEERVQKVKQAKQINQQENRLIKQQLLKMSDKIAEMESTVVKSPEEYKAQFTNYSQDCTEKKERLQGMFEKLRDKRELKSLFEKVKDFINQEYEKFPKVVDTRCKSKTLENFRQELSKRFNEMQTALQNLHEELRSPNDISQDDTAKIDEVRAQCQEHLTPHEKSYMKLLSQFRDVQQRVDEAQISYQQSHNEREESHKTITNLENEITEFLKDCQGLYKSDIQKVIIDIDSVRKWTLRECGRVDVESANNIPELLSKYGRLLPA